MSTDTRISGTELHIVDNSNQAWKVLAYLHDGCQLSSAIDIASGLFKIGALLGLDGEWQKVDHSRILMGDEVPLRTKQTLSTWLKQVGDRLDSSLEAEKEGNDFLRVVPAIVEGLRSGKIECRVFRKAKFHAKAYITHARQAVIGSFGLVGSLNFTLPGLTDSTELNAQLTGAQVGLLQDWYERHWDDAEDVTEGVLQTVERQLREYSPFEVCAKALDELFRGYRLTSTEWEEASSSVFPVLDKYQQDQTRPYAARGPSGACLSPRRRSDQGLLPKSPQVAAGCLTPTALLKQGTVCDILHLAAYGHTFGRRKLAVLACAR